MDLELTISGALCTTDVFNINGIKANPIHFGEKMDHRADEKDRFGCEYGCLDMRFQRKAPSAQVLERYQITEEEYHEIAGKLEEGLSFGCCDMCE